MAYLEQQIEQSLSLLNNVLAQDVLAVYLYGSAIVGGLQKYSDIDLLVVTDRATTLDEKKLLVSSLLHISGIYMKSANYPIELTVVVKSDVIPWKYPPQFDFQYGEWLRTEFENGHVEPWSSKNMPDLALLITQVLLSGKALMGPIPSELLSQVPYADFIKALSAGLSDLMDNLESDTRNVLLTLARMWHTLETDTIHTKPESAHWATSRVLKECQLVLQRANAICLGEENEYWEDINTSIKPCAHFIYNRINDLLSIKKTATDLHQAIKIHI